MGIFNKDKPSENKEESKDTTHDDLQRIKEKVMKNKIDKSEQLGYEKPKKTDFPETSDNLGDNATTDMKLVKILNEIETLKGKIDEISRKDVTEIKNVLENIDHMADIIKEIPKETLAEMRNMKKNMPDMYQGIAQNTAKHLHASVLGAIDSNILKIIKESTKINSRDLLEKIEEKKVCSKNTLYSHLAKLEEEGYLTRKREVHEVYYMVTDSVKDSMNSQETPKKEEGNNEETKPEPKKEEKPAEPKEDSQKSKKVPEKEASRPKPAEAAQTPAEKAPKTEGQKPAEPKEPAAKEAPVPA